MSTQALYFHLCLQTDDDGFVSGTKGVLRRIGATESDLSELKETGFILDFPESSAIVITDHKRNNVLRSDRHHVTQFQRELSTLTLDKNQRYCRLTTNCQPNDNQMTTEPNITEPNRTEPNVTEPNVTQSNVTEPNVREVGKEELLEMFGKIDFGRILPEHQQSTFNKEINRHSQKTLVAMYEYLSDKEKIPWYEFKNTLDDLRRTA